MPLVKNAAFRNPYLAAEALGYYAGERLDDWAVENGYLPKHHTWNDVYNYHRYGPGRNAPSGYLLRMFGGEFKGNNEKLRSPEGFVSTLDPNRKEPPIDMTKLRSAVADFSESDKTLANFIANKNKPNKVEQTRPNNYMLNVDDMAYALGYF